MADPLSATSAIIGLVPVSFQAAKALRDTIRGIKNHPKQIRSLLEELDGLVVVLEELEYILRTPGEMNLNLLEAPLKRCDCACKEFARALQDCRGRSSGGDRSDFAGWLKIQWRGSDINEFKDTLASYKSTIAIAIAGANLRTTKVNLDVIREYQRMIREAKADLNEHLTNIDDKLQGAPQEPAYPEQTGNNPDMQAERDCTIRCLEICAQVSGFIEERQRSIASHGGAVEDSLGSDPKKRPFQRDTGQTLQSCNTKVKAQHTQLLRRLQVLNRRLRGDSGDAVESEDQVQMIEEAETIRQCLDICEQSAKDAESARVNVIEDVTGAEDSTHIIVSTIGDLIAAHRVTSGARSNMTIGQMSDETVQHLSTVHASRLAELSKSQADVRTGRDAARSTGRVLGQSNVKTL